MIERIRSVAQIVIDEYEYEYEGRSRTYLDDCKERQRGCSAVHDLPGFGEQKAKIFIALTGKQLNEAPSGWKAASTLDGGRASRCRLLT